MASLGLIVSIFGKTKGRIVVVVPAIIIKVAILDYPTFVVGLRLRKCDPGQTEPARWMALKGGWTGDDAF